jgi:hypothetical protein
MRFGQDEPAFLKPEDNGGLEQGGGEENGESEGVDVENDPLFPEEEENKKKKKPTKS